MLNLRINKKRIFAAFFVYITFTSCATAPSYSTAGDFLESGTRYYRGGNYLAASAALSWAIKQNPGNANTHYLLANSLIQLGRFSEAEQQYRAALQLSKDPQVQSYCQAALTKLASRGNQPGFTAPTPATQLAQPPAAAPIQTQPVSLPHQQAADTIDRQANMTSVGWLNDSNANAAAWQRSGAYLAEKERLKAENTAQAMERTRISGSKSSLYSPEEIAAARQNGLAQSDLEVALAKEKSDRAVQYAKAKVWETQAAAKNLQDQLNAPSLPGSVKIKAEGTSLYVRNFESNPAIAEKALSAGELGKLNVTVPLKARPQSLSYSGSSKNGGSGHQEKKTESTVYGQVLP